MHTLTLFRLPTQAASQALSPMMGGMGEDICVSFVPHDRSFFPVGGPAHMQQPSSQSDDRLPPRHSLSTFLLLAGPARGSATAVVLVKLAA